jgi:hypothetical protein
VSHTELAEMNAAFAEREAEADKLAQVVKDKLACCYADARRDGALVVGGQPHYAR